MSFECKLPREVTIALGIETVVRLITMALWTRTTALFNTVALRAETAA